MRCVLGGQVFMIAKQISGSSILVIHVYFDLLVRFGSGLEIVPWATLVVQCLVAT